MCAKFQGCTIWQVARATSAATTFFKPAVGGRDGVEFIDAALGYNNPCEVLIRKAQESFPDRPRMQILSVGTGLGDVVGLQHTRLSIMNVLKKMATSSKEVAARLETRYTDDGDYDYHRFSVDQGLQDITFSDWEKASTISAHTDNYLKRNDQRVWEFVNSIVGVAPAGVLNDGTTGPLDASSTCPRSPGR